MLGSNAGGSLKLGADSLYLALYSSARDQVWFVETMSADDAGTRTYPRDGQILTKLS
jgi:hypothetical protein